MKQIILVFFFKNCTTMHFFAFFSHIYIIIISTIFSVPAQWSQWSKHTWFWSSRVRTPPGARLDKLQILEKFQIQTNFRFRQILDKKIGYRKKISTILMILLVLVIIIMMIIVLAKIINRLFHEKSTKQPYRSQGNTNL